MMGTVVEITLVSRDRESSENAIRGAFGEMRRIDKLMSRRIEGSDVWMVNQGAWKAGVTVSSDSLSVVRIALEMSELSDGAFDITVGSLVRLWTESWKENRVPSREEVEESLRLVGYRNLVIDGENRSLTFKKKGMGIVLGGIAKGYAVDRAFQFLHDNGFEDLIVNAGGDLRTGGSKLGRPWMVGIQDPRDESKMVATMEVNDGAIATSGDYERYYMKDGVRYHHILDPVTGFPARGCQSVTILSEELVWADAVATAVFVLGPQRGMALVERLPTAEAMIIDSREEIRLSTGMKGSISF
jgi:thiamine biosynthesis lipoprotein